MKEQLRISAKDLGAMALPDFCPRCFWIEWHSDSLPFPTPFAGIFSSIDSYTKKVTNIHHDKHNHIPKWFQKFGIKGVPQEVSKNFFIEDNATNIKLTGIPDEVLKDGKNYTILDYKTARFTEHQDELFPMYEIQLNGYAWIADQTGFSPVTKLGLVYYEPQTNLTLDSIQDFLRPTGFTMPFDANYRAVDLNVSKVKRLLKQSREIMDLKKPPKGKSDCENCESVKNLLELLN
ncbi:MAG: PD-(D/E)XK nuclease family protein [Bacteroidetes bacterium]|nr:PD-(D/E)XK nuclease family protein [Bacteroidota bacterium]